LVTSNANVVPKKSRYQKRTITQSFYIAYSSYANIKKINRLKFDFS